MYSSDMNRRTLLKVLGVSSFGFAVGEGSYARATVAGKKPLEGIFPIAQTPFTESNKLDVHSLVEELRFIDRGGVPGFVWPQLASEWSSLIESERLEGAEAITSAGKECRPAIVIGVQAETVAGAVKYAKHAAKAGADAIISLPPPRENDEHALLEYYKAVGSATDLPLFVQAVGQMSVDLLIQIYKSVPTCHYVKDEAGKPLERVAELRARSSDQLKVFTGGHGRTLIDEMIRGFSGSMPAASFADLYAATWDLWHQGKEREAVETFGDAALLINEIGAYGLESMKYILCVRGVFKTYKTREQPARDHKSGASASNLASGAAASSADLDETSKQVLRELLQLMKPRLRA
jgi:dihydrodipicolinate synthase/N-acetylneuraminate lyase